jgi:rubredoxin
MMRIACFIFFLASIALALRINCNRVTFRVPVLLHVVDPADGNTNEGKNVQAQSTIPLSDRITLKAQEIFVSRNTGKFECQACGYVYDEEIGVPQKGILPGVTFDSLEKFRCPQCGANKKYFVAEQETLSGFKENQKYGLGANSLTGDQKGALIFGGLFLGFVIFMSGYLLE